MVDFTEPYFASDQGALVMEGTEMETVEDAKALQWGVQSGTTGSTYLIDVLQPEQEPQVFQDLAAGFAALQAGQVDVFMMDTAIVLAQAAESGGAQEVVAQFETGEEYGGILPQGLAERRRHQRHPRRARGRRLAVGVRRGVAGRRPERDPRPHAVTR